MCTECPPGLSAFLSTRPPKGLKNIRYSGYREKLDSETGFNPVVQAQLKISFPQAAAQLIGISWVAAWGKLILSWA